MRTFKNLSFLIIATILIATNFYCTQKEKKDMTKKLSEFIKKHVDTIAPMYKDAATAYFDASISGKPEDFEKVSKLEIGLNKIYSNKQDFAKLKEFKASTSITDTLLNRQLDVLYNNYVTNQVDDKKLEAIIKQNTEIEKQYTTFRAKINGNELTDNELEKILETSNNTEELKEHWLASKEIGSLVINDVMEIIKMRNEIATDLGYANYHDMSLKANEQDPAEIDRIFDELDNLTRNTYKDLKKEIDTHLAAKHKISEDELMPWHYENRFFQEAPKIYPINLDNYYKDKDLVKLTSNYFAGIGIPIDDIIANSDLFEKEGKYQHAYCSDIDRKGDVRVVCNIKPNQRWMNTMLHEFGHAAYDKFMDESIPYILREPAHTFTTEAIAMLFGRFAANPKWMQDILDIPEEEKTKIAESCFNTLRLEQLVFSRWVQVVYRFEKAMYENPEQDLNKLWWDIVENYQMIKRPENRDKPDWATKIHIALYPCYYHNYMLGELLASQLYYHITEKVLNATKGSDQSFANKPEVGEYMKNKIFSVAKIYHWNTMIEKATGEKLTAKYYAKQFVN